jgi:hypothetical protein
MAQLSRPYQIGLVAVAVLAAAWLLLLQGHSSSPKGTSAGSSPSPATRTVTAPSAAPKAAHAQAAPKAHAEGNAGSATGGGSASSVGGLGHAIEKARGAVGASQRNAKELQSKSAQASSPNSSSSASAAAPGAASHAKSAVPSAGSKSTSAPRAQAKTTPAPAGTHPASAPARQRTVEAQLRHGRIAVIYFWNPKGSDDVAVHRALNQLSQQRSLRIAIDQARPGEVASFGTITRGVQVYGTPTLLVVNKKGRVTTLTGLQDPYTIAQAIREARHS